MSFSGLLVHLKLLIIHKWNERVKAKEKPKQKLRDQIEDSQNDGRLQFSPPRENLYMEKGKINDTI